MTLTPRDLPELRETLQHASREKTTLSNLSLRHLAQVICHTPQDMVATVQAGATLQDFQNHLARSGQWLPIDPPRPDRLSIGNLVSWNLSGPSRWGYGTIRDHLIGIRVVLADGRLIHNGGQVVKNVAGYDLCKLFVGSRNALGIVVEATFKLRPLPQRRTLLQVTGNLERATKAVLSVLNSPLTPSILDICREEPNQDCKVVLGLDGTEKEVAWQTVVAQSMGFAPGYSTDYSFLQRDPWDITARKVSVLPTNLSDEIKKLAGKPFVARAGNGVLYFEGGKKQPALSDPPYLLERVKQVFDPAGLLKELVT